MNSSELASRQVASEDLAGDAGAATREESRASAAASASDAFIPPELPHERRLAAINAAQNPLLEAALPLLRFLSDMPPDLNRDSVPALSKMLEREVTTFQSLCHAAKIRHEHVVAASYSLCTAIDEAAQGSPWGGPQAKGDAGLWANKLLAQRFHGDHQGGEKVFMLVGRLAANPQEHIDLLELVYLILGLGFEGRYRNIANGRRELETIRHRLLALLGASRGEVPTELAMHWQGVGGNGKFRLMRSLPVWVTASVLGLGLVGLFGWYKYQLGHTGAQLTQQIGDIGRLKPPARPQPPLKPLRLKALLADEIRRGTVAVEEDDVRSAVTFKGDDMFVPGRAQLTKRVLPVLNKVAEQVVDVAGTVVVTGHTDSVPIRTREFPDNQVLSEKRAQAVADVLLGAGVAPARVKVMGRGDSAPLADNASAAGRARNRRVDIVVRQQGGEDDTATTVAPAAGR